MLRAIFKPANIVRFFLFIYLLLKKSYPKIKSKEALMLNSFISIKKKKKNQT